MPSSVAPAGSLRLLPPPRPAPLNAAAAWRSRHCCRLPPPTAASIRRSCHFLPPPSASSLRRHRFGRGRPVLLLSLLSPAAAPSATGCRPPDLLRAAAGAHRPGTLLWFPLAIAGRAQPRRRRPTVCPRRHLQVTLFPYPPWLAGRSPSSTRYRWLTTTHWGSVVRR